MGQVRVTGSASEDLTPSGKKVAGLLALISVANGEVCSRSWLQEKLWSDRGVKQAQDSLRHALSVLKKCLGKHSCILIVNREGVALDRDRTLIDIYDDLSPQSLPIVGRNQFLSSLNIRDKAFVRWKASICENIGQKINGKRVDVVDNSSINIGIPPAVAFENDSMILGQIMIARLGEGLRQLGPFSIYDYTGRIESCTTDTEPDVLLLLRAAPLDGVVILTLSLTCVSTKKVLWNRVHSVGEEEMSIESISTASVYLADQIANVLASPMLFQNKDRHIAAKSVLGAIDKMFSVSPGNLDSAERAFIQAIELDPKGIYYAWYAYLMVFRFGELKEEHEKDLKGKAHQLAEIALEKDRCNPLTLGLLGQVYSFIFRDFDKAELLLGPAIAMKQNTIFAMDSYALLKFYQGNLEEARSVASRVYDSSMFSPYRFCFATSLCMIDTVLGNYSSAADFGEKAICLQKKGQKTVFGPILRYLSVAQAESGNQERANELFQTLNAQEPSFQPSKILEENYPMPNKNAALILNKSLKRIENGIRISRV